jgi:hypothetical protein
VLKDAEVLSTSRELEVAVYMSSVSRSQYADMSTLPERVEALLPVVLPHLG